MSEMESQREEQTEGNGWVNSGVVPSEFFQSGDFLLTKKTRNDLDTLFCSPGERQELFKGACRALNYIPHMDEEKPETLFVGCKSRSIRMAEFEGGEGSSCLITLCDGVDSHKECLLVETKRLLPVLVTLLVDMRTSETLKVARARADVVATLEIDMYDLPFRDRVLALFSKASLSVGEYFSLAISRIPLVGAKDSLCASAVALFRETKLFGFAPKHKTPQVDDRYLLEITRHPGGLGRVLMAKVPNDGDGFKKKRIVHAGMGELQPYA